MRPARWRKLKMNASKVVFALIMVAILFSGSVVAVFVYTNLQNGRIVHISVMMDRPSYSAGENVTFKLIDNTPDIEFNLSDPNSSPQNIVFGSGEINIVRIPDDVDPDTVVTDLSDENRFQRQLSTELSVATVHYGYFNSQEAPKNMTWDGTIAVHSPLVEDISYTTATTGYYVIVPNFLSAADHRVHFDVDRGAIFYYDSLDARVNITNNPDHNVTTRLLLGAPPGTVGDLTCELFTDFQYTEFPATNTSSTTVLKSDNYHNETLILTPGNDVLRTIVYEAKIPDHGEKVGGTTSFQMAFFHALLVTPVGNYTFGFGGTWDGAWEHVYQY
jgi:hypothetical protein